MHLLKMQSVVDYNEAPHSIVKLRAIVFQSLWAMMSYQDDTLYSVN